MEDSMTIQIYRYSGVSTPEFEQNYSISPFTMGILNCYIPNMFNVVEHNDNMRCRGVSYVLP